MQRLEKSLKQRLEISLSFLPNFYLGVIRLSTFMLSKSCQFIKIIRVKISSIKIRFIFIFYLITVPGFGENKIAKKSLYFLKWTVSRGKPSCKIVAVFFLDFRFHAIFLFNLFNLFERHSSLTKLATLSHEAD